MTRQPYIVAGKRVPSVTTVIGRFKESGGLIHWAHGVAYEVLGEAVDILSNFRDRQHSELDMKERAKHFLSTDPLTRGDHRDVSKKATDAGTIAHELVELELHTSAPKPKVPTLKEIQQKYKCNRECAASAQRAFKAFLDWRKKHKFKVLHTEIRLSAKIDILPTITTSTEVALDKSIDSVESKPHGPTVGYHPDSLDSLGFGGTIDCVGYFENEGQGLCIFDWKTSKGLYSDYVIQLAAYEMLWNITAKERGVPKIAKGAHLIRFDKLTADFTHSHFGDMANERKQFLRFLQCYDAAKGINKRV